MNTDRKLEGKRVAIVATDGFQKSELFDPREALIAAGAEVDVLSIHSGKIKSWADGDWSDEIEVDGVLSDADSSDYDALMLPGGVINADKLRIDADAVAFVNDFVDCGKPIAAICHAPWILIETGKLHGRKMTSWPSLKTDLENSGVHWMNAAVVVDGGWVTSRMPADLEVFNAKMTEEFCEGRHPAPPPRDQASASSSPPVH
jgi:protease I